MEDYGKTPTKPPPLPMLNCFTQTLAALQDLNLLEMVSPTLGLMNFTTRLSNVLTTFRIVKTTSSSDGMKLKLSLT